VARALNNLASVYRKKQYARLNPFFQRAVAIREKLLASENPQMAVLLSNWANLYESEGSIQRPSLSLSAQWRSRKSRSEPCIQNSPQA